MKWLEIRGGWKSALIKTGIVFAGGAVMVFVTQVSLLGALLFLACITGVGIWTAVIDYREEPLWARAWEALGFPTLIALLIFGRELPLWLWALLLFPILGLSYLAGHLLSGKRAPAEEGA